MIKVDSEFKGLIPPLNKEEYKQLEENCVKEGIREPLIVWRTPSGDDILVDGHNRFEIAAKHSLKCEFRQMKFENRNEAMFWMIKNQLGRRNISAYDRTLLALKLKPEIEKKAKENQRLGGKGSQKSANHKTDTREELATIASVSHDTIHKVQMIEKKAPEAVKEAARKGDISINEAYKRTVDKIVKPRDVVKEAKERHEQFKEAKQEEVISFEDAKQDEDDKSILSIDLYQEICKAVHGFDKLSIMRDEDQIEELFKSMEKYAYSDLMNRLTRCHRTILWLQRMVEEGRTNG